MTDPIAPQSLTIPPSVLQPIDSAIQAIRDQPWGIHLVMGGLLLFGLLLWSLGRRVLRPMVALIGAGVGGIVGFVALPVTFPGSGLSPYAGLIGGLVIGLLLALFLYKVATAAAFGVIVGIASVLIAAGVLARTSSAPAMNPSAGQQVAEAVKKAVDDALAPTDPNVITPAGQLDQYPHLGPMAKSVRDLARTARQEVSQRWQAIPEAHKPWVAISGLGGLVIGFLLGFVLPKWSGGVVTGLLGAAIWLAAGVWLWHAFALPGSEAMTRIAPIGWALVWLFMGLVGITIQSKLGGKKPAAASPAAAPTTPEAR